MQTTIYGRELEVAVGSHVKPDGWQIGGSLQASDWSEADFYLPTNSGGPIKALAVNVTITGYTLKRMMDSQYVRVKIEFVGDGEPSTFSGGWLHVGY